MLLSKVASISHLLLTVITPTGAVVFDVLVGFLLQLPGLRFAGRRLAARGVVGGDPLWVAHAVRLLTMPWVVQGCLLLLCLHAVGLYPAHVFASPGAAMLVLGHLRCLALCARILALIFGLVPWRVFVVNLLNVRTRALGFGSPLAVLGVATYMRSVLSGMGLFLILSRRRVGSPHDPPHEARDTHARFVDGTVAGVYKYVVHNGAAYGGAKGYYYRDLEGILDSVGTLVYSGEKRPTQE